MLVVPSVLSRVDVTVKVVEVPWSETSVVLMLTVRPEIESQLVAAAVGDKVNVSEDVQLESTMKEGMVHEYAEVSIV